MSKGGNNKPNTAQVSGGFLIGLICLSRSTWITLELPHQGKTSEAVFVPVAFWDMGMFAAQH